MSFLISMFLPKIRRVSRCGDKIDIFETKTAQEIDLLRTERDNVVYWKTKGKINNDLDENILFTVFQFDFGRVCTHAFNRSD